MTTQAPAQPDLFKDYSYGLHKPTVSPDVCESRHGGVSTSAEANKRVCKHQDRATILDLVRAAKDGLTLKEACSVLGRTPNQISGRFTELKMLGKIEVRGTRDGCGINFSTQSGGLLEVKSCAKFERKNP